MLRDRPGDVRRRTVLRLASGAAAALAGCAGRDPTDDGDGADEGGDESDSTDTPGRTRETETYRGRARVVEGGFHCEDGPTGTSVGVVFVTDNRRYLLTGAARPEFDAATPLSSRGECATVVGYVEESPGAAEDCQFAFRSLPRLVATEYRPGDDCVP